MKKMIMLSLMMFSVLFINTHLFAAEPVTDVKQDTVVNVAQFDSDLTTFVKLVKAADLTDTLQNKGPWTVFAPSNRAFDKLPPGTVERLLKPENKATLKSVLMYHIVPQELMANNLVNEKVKTLSGRELGIHTAGNTIMVDNAKVIDSDDVGSNGVVHVIDTVLMP